MAENMRDLQSHPIKILDWYDRNARKLPWRVLPNERTAGTKVDPYRVWLSEIMLQQTTVAAVWDYFTAFTEKWPTVFDLSDAQESDILKAWSGLGYYTRARNLKKCADKLVKDFNGRFPESEYDLRQLPGIGTYTAAAISAIAFDRVATVVDGNVERVITRLYAIKTPLPGAKKLIAQHAKRLTPEVRPGDYAQALMDLGATICTRRNPQCNECPWQSSCQARSQGTPEQFPFRSAKGKKPVRRGVAFAAVRKDGAILLRQRPPKGLLASMSEIPGSDWVAVTSFPTKSELMQIAPFSANWKKAGKKVNHTFTHFNLELEIWRTEVPLETSAPPMHWWSLPEEVPDEALPTLMRKAIAVGTETG